VLSKVKICSKESLLAVLDKLGNIFGRLVGPKIILPSLPRYLFMGCCMEEGHCEGIDAPTHAPELLGNCGNVRKVLDEHLGSKLKNICVPETVGRMFPECTNLGSLANSLKPFFAPASVYLTRAGYAKLVDILVEDIANKFSASSIVSGPKKGGIGEKPSAFFWRGFNSPCGSEQPREKYFSQKHKNFGSGTSRFNPYSVGRGGGGQKQPPPPTTYRGRRFN